MQPDSTIIYVFMRSVHLVPFCAIAICAAADSPLIPGEKAVREAQVGAGEGPAWDGKGNLYFTGGGRITRRDSSGKYHTVREGTTGVNGLIFDKQGRLIVCESGAKRVVR